ncbi:MAG: hypothetical protein HQK97_02220, partial [Nitrospirae bacterium]|nr:hypothetical protein [Nitrospirota bacterium]
MRSLCKYTLVSALLTIVLCGVSYAEISNGPIPGVTVTQQAPVSVVTTEEMKKNEVLLPLKSTPKRIIPFNRRHTPSSAVPHKSQFLPELQSHDSSNSSNLGGPQSSVQAPSLLTSFAGMDLNGNADKPVPPDTMGAAGPVYLMSILNGGVAYYNKTTGAMSNHITDTAFWSSLGTGSGQPADGVFDPKVIYDQYLGRFITVELSEGTTSTNSYILIGISSTSDPNGTWTLHAIRADLNNGSTPTTNWADFPAVGMDAGNLYVAVNMFDANGNFQYVKAYSIPKTQLISTTPTITYTEFIN